MSKMNFMMVLLLALIGSAADAVAQKDGVRQQIDQAVRLTDERLYDRSETLLREALESDARNFRAQYELARVYYLRGDYSAAAKLAREALRCEGAEDVGYQLLGNACDDLGSFDKALAVYEKGLKRFPDSGRLCWELGQIANNDNDYLRAIRYYERGIEAEPGFAPNYYHVAAVFLSSSEKVWGMLYGEIFMLLERESPRTEAMSRFLYEGYRTGITLETGDKPGEWAVDARFSRSHRVDYTQDGQIALPYGTGVYEPLVVVSFPRDAEQVSIGTLVKMRRSFADNYFEMREGLRGRLATAPDYPNVLFDYQRAAAEAGHAEAYNYWVLRYGDTAQFDAWLSSHRKQWKAFQSWFAEHPLVLSKARCFNRRQYEDAAFTEH